MKLWSLYPLFLFAPLAGSASVASLQKGDEALAAGLWEVAEMHFRNFSADTSLTPEMKSEATIRLAESLIRQGNPAEALDLLGQSFAAAHPENSFWKAQALAGQNRFSDAIDIFSKLLLDPQTPHRLEAGMTQASLQLALDQAEAALGTLHELLPQADAASASWIQLYQVEILLDLKRTAEARLAMPPADQVPPKHQGHAAFLEAQLLLREGKTAEARLAFQELVNQPQNQSLTRYHLAAIGLADAIQAQGDSDAAIKSLLAFLQEHPDSPQMSAIFQRIFQWLPEKPTVSDPNLERIAQWITPPVLQASGLVTTASSAPGSDVISAWPDHEKATRQSALLAHALFTRAVGLYRIGTPESQAEARSLLFRLRVEYPAHLLTQRALYQQARWHLDAGSGDQAFAILDTLRENMNLPDLKGEAAFLKAYTAYSSGDVQQAIQLFDEAASRLSDRDAKVARRQAQLARLRSGDHHQAINLIQQQGSPQDQSLAADLELEKALSTQLPDAARKELEAFITRFPDHPRITEARLAMIEIVLASSPPDLVSVQAQLEHLPTEADVSLAPRIALARLRLLDFSNDQTATIAAAQAILADYPGSPAAAEAALTLGRNLFQSGSYNPARLVLEKLAATDSDPSRAQVAWLLAARSAALGGTSQSKEEALILFEKATEAKGPVSSIANLEKARHLIDMNRLTEASSFLGKWIETLSLEDPLQLPAGLLLGETLYAQGSSNPASLVEALAVYDELLARVQDQPALFNRLQYLRGTTLEQLPEVGNPTKKREKEAFQAYHSVLETPGVPQEWEYFERCGFRALALLEKAERWSAAITVAKKISSFNGPRAEEAANHARQLQLKHMIWEDE